MKLLPSKGDQWELLSSNFKLGTKLGKGNYGQVYKGTLSVDVATAPAKRYIARQTSRGKPPDTVAIKLLKGAQFNEYAIVWTMSLTFTLSHMNTYICMQHIHTHTCKHTHANTHTHTTCPFTYEQDPQKGEQWRTSWRRLPQ